MSGWAHVVSLCIGHRQWLAGARARPTRARPTDDVCNDTSLKQRLGFWGHGPCQGQVVTSMFCKLSGLQPSTGVGGVGSRFRHPQMRWLSVTRAPCHKGLGRQTEGHRGVYAHARVYAGEGVGSQTGFFEEEDDKTRVGGRVCFWLYISWSAGGEPHRVKTKRGAIEG